MPAFVLFSSSLSFLFPRERFQSNIGSKKAPSWSSGRFFSPPKSLSGDTKKLQHLQVRQS